MAGDWIKMRPELLREPEVIGISHRLGVTRQHVIGCLLGVWGVGDQHAESRLCPDGTGTIEGHLSRYGLDDIDREAGHVGFALAMEAEGWLIQREDGISFPEWDAHNSRSAKTRACESKKKQRQRAGEPKLSTKLSQKCPDATGTEQGTREEKRREESNTHTHTDARTRGEQQSQASPLKTWDAPKGADPLIIEAVDKWQAHRLAIDGRQVPPTGIDALIAEATRKGWSPEKIARSVQFTIAKNRDWWLDPDIDFEQQRKQQTQTANPDRKPTWAERHAKASEGDPF